MCLADDDFFAKTGLIDAIEYLDKNKDQVACIGQAIGVDFDLQKKCAYYFPYGASLENYQIIHEDPVERIRKGINHYRSATSYAVFRTLIFKKTWLTIQATSCLEATEYEQALCTYIQGSFSSIKSIYWIRSFECDPIDSSVDGSRRLDFVTWWNSLKYKDECNNFVNRQAKLLSEHSSLNLNEANSAIRETIKYILSGKHTGLTNANPTLSVVENILKLIKFFHFLDKGWTIFKTTKLGKKLKNTLKIGIRFAAKKSKENHKDEEINLELEDILALLTTFNLSK